MNRINLYPFLVFLFALCSLFFLIGCNRGRVNNEKEIIVSISEEHLTRQRLNEAIGKGLTKIDSLRLSEAYIRNWIEEVLLYEKARKNISNLDEINSEAEAYRRRMIIFEYQQQLMNERLSKDLSEEELEAFYKENQNEFKLEQPILKGLFLKVPVDAPQLSEVKKWMKKVDDETLEKIEKYSLQNALVYEYFLDRWVSFDDIMKNIPYEISNSNRFLKENNHLEVVQGDYWYYLYIRSYLSSGVVSPYDHARAQIQEALLNQKKRGFIRSVEEELYQKALREKEIVFYESEPEALN